MRIYQQQNVPKVQYVYNDEVYGFTFLGAEDDHYDFNADPLEESWQNAADLVQGEISDLWNTLQCELNPEWC